jgi:hypothetical protein
MNMEIQRTPERVRINLTQSSKGIVQFDVTAEAETPEKAEALLNAALDKARGTIAAKGLKEAGE